MLILIGILAHSVIAKKKIEKKHACMQEINILFSIVLGNYKVDY
jgi:hypothetical protein